MTLSPHVGAGNLGHLEKQSGLFWALSLAPTMSIFNLVGRFSISLLKPKTFWSIIWCTKFHTWPNKKTQGVFKILYAVTFRICIWNMQEIEMNFAYLFGFHLQNVSFLKKIFLNLCIHVPEDAFGGWKSESDPLELELQMLVNLPTWV